MTLSRVSRTAVTAGEAGPYYRDRAESAQHYALKHAAVAWMEEQGATDAWVEKPCFTGRADAFSPSKEWAAECGCTAIGKLVGAIQAGAVRFTLIPYQGRSYREDGSMPCPIAIDFHWEPSLSDEFQRPPYGQSTVTADQICAEIRAAYLARVAVAEAAAAPALFHHPV